MKDAQKPNHINLNSLISKLKEGRYVIPDFQREFKWNPSDVRDLMRSIFLDYYIGTLLLWKGKKENFELLDCEHLYGHTGDRNPDYIVLDGQQRLTAMYYAFHAPNKPLPYRKMRFFYFIRVDRFVAEEYDEAFDYIWVSDRWQLLDNVDAQFMQHIFPLAVVGKGIWEIADWIDGYKKYWEERKSNAEKSESTQDIEIANIAIDNSQEFRKELADVTQEFQISFIELEQELEIEKICDIFTQINSRGIKLDTFDLMNALLKPKNIPLKQIWREAQKHLEFIESKQMNIYILQTMSVLRQAYCSSKYLYYLIPGSEKPLRDIDGKRRIEVLVPNAEDFMCRWKQSVDAMKSAIDLIKHPQEFGVISSKYLPYASILPAFAALQETARQLPPDEQLNARRKIRHWYWASVFTNRYSGAVESTTARDFLDVSQWIKNDSIAPPLIQELNDQYRNLDLHSQQRSGTSIYNGIFNLFVVHGARDWITGNLPQYGNLDDHHIVPVSWCRKNMLGEVAHTILNRSPLTVDTNRNVIVDQLPSQYLPKWMKSNGEEVVRDILESHFISRVAQEILLRERFGKDDYVEFISEREVTLKDAIANLLIKERLDLEPSLRKLDEQVEKVELNIRRIISQTIRDSQEMLPEHVLQKIEERLSGAARKDAAMDLNYYQTLEGKLEYCDLRELQSTILNKRLWPKFANYFANKGMVIQRFDQLANLRNGIRHSRTVTEVIRKDGEASIAWFNKVLPQFQRLS